MRFEKKRRKSWLLIFPILAILLVVGLAAIAVNGNAGTTSTAVRPAQMNRPSGAAPANVAGQLASAASAQGKDTRYPNGVRVIEEVAHVTSPPVRDLPPIEPVVSDRIENESADNLDPVGMGPSLVDTVVQDFFGPLVMPTPIVNFDGIDRTISFCNCLPPDTNGDVGPNHYVQWVNLAFRIWDKAGNPLTPSMAGNTLFTPLGGQCATQNNGDPIALYDPLADRWFLSQFLSSAPYGMCIAVSTTPDPTGSYNLYHFNFGSTYFYDYEKYGVWPDGYYFSANAFNDTSIGPAFYPAAGVFERDKMLLGQPARYIEINPGNYYGNLLPSDLDGTTPPPAGAPNYFASTSGTSTNFHLWRFFTDWTTPTNSHMDGPFNMAVAPIDPNLCNGSRNCLPQPGTAVRLDALGNRLMYRLAYRNMGTYETLLSNQTVDENGLDHAGIRWYEVRDPATSPYIYQQGTFAPDADHRWMGSMAMDAAGNIAMGYSVTSSTVFPSLRYAGRLAGDPLGQMAQGEGTMIAGTGSQTSGTSRWGDYSNVSIDPSDDCTFWVTNEYYATTSAANWRTRIGSFKFPGCVAGPQPTPTGTPPTPRPTNTVAPPTPTPCSNYTSSTGTGVIVPGTTNIGNNCDDCTTLITLPFPVQLYERTFTTAYVSSNGTIQFQSSDSAYGNACLPVQIFEYASIPFWMDLYTGDVAGGQGVFTSVTGSAPNRIFTVEWRANVCCSAGIALNFASRFYEGTNQVDHVYGAMANNGSTATTGLQRDPGTATQFSCFQGVITPGLVVTFNAPACPAVTNTPVPPTSTNTAVPTASPTVGVCTIQFIDVPPGHTFYEAVRCLACRGIVSGYSDGTFRPNNQVTRGQLAKMVSNAAGFTEDPNPQIFTDVPPSNTFYEWINRLARRGHMGGYACGGPGEPCVNNMPYFRPFANATRGQTSKIVSNAAGFTEMHTSQTFQDVPPTHTFYQEIERLASRNVMGGYPCGGPGEPCIAPQNRPYFRPGNDVTRGQSAKIVANTFFPDCFTP